MTTTTINYSSAETADSMPDLLQGISSGDPSAWDEIMRRYGRLVSTTVRSFRLQEADALDAIQTTWLRLAENAHRVQHPERLAGWLATTARRECLRTLRQAKSGPNLTDWTLEAVSDPSAGPEQRAIDANTAQMLRDLIDELPPLRRKLIRMLFTDNPRSYAEIADIAGIPLGGIGPTRARALRQLREKIDEYELGPIGSAAPDLPGQRRTVSPSSAVKSAALTFSPPTRSLASSSRVLTA